MLYSNPVATSATSFSSSQNQFKTDSVFTALSAIEKLDLNQVNHHLADGNANQIVMWADQQFGRHLVMSTSFGIQSAVMLHLVTEIIPDIPIIWIDTGYLPKETYLFAEELTKRLNLNLKVYQSEISPARMEALYGKLWQEKDLESLNFYDRLRKVEPMQRALRELDAKAWLAGLRQDQTQFRQKLEYVHKQGEQYKISPILTWNSRDIYQYLISHNLPYHPYFDLGYVSVGDWHNSRPLMAEDQDERDTRFHGVKQECGLHLPLNPDEAQSLDSSQL
jgi:phosphoadenosine phosphosulfate reductase